MKPSTQPIYSSRSFITGPYYPDANGVYRPETPTKCPNARDGDSCLIRIDSWRLRKLGPDFPLAVFVCLEHHVYFTAYPSGFFPYSRKSLVPLTPEGQVIKEVPPEDMWKDTIFEAIHDAAKGIIWPPEKSLGVDSDSTDTSGCLRTQKHSLHFFMSLFGLLKTDTPKKRENVANLLSINLAELEESTRLMNPRVRDGPLLEVRSALGMKLLKILHPTEQLLRKLLSLGAGWFWGTPVYQQEFHHI